MKKIMFNDKYSLTQAVLEGRKTMTRRIITRPETYKGQPVRGFRVTESKDIRLSVEMRVYDEDCDDFTPMYIQPRYEASEIVAIAQSYKSLGMNPELPLNDKDGIGFYTKTKFAPGWKNKMFVRADLMPHHIRIINIKIERLQDISDGDCAAEGIRVFKNGFACYDDKVLIAKSNIYPSPREAYTALIDRSSGKGTWESNPFVFAYEFELVD